jgi:hypothetical protein
MVTAAAAGCWLLLVAAAATGCCCWLLYSNPGSLFFSDPQRILAKIHSRKRVNCFL